MLDHHWNSVDKYALCSACTTIMDMHLHRNWSAPAFHIISYVFEDAVLLHKKLLLCVIFCWPLTFQLQPILQLHCQLRPKIKYLHRSWRTINLSMKCFFPNWSLRSHWLTGPKLVPLAVVTLCVCTFDKFGYWGSELKKNSEATDIFAPVPSNDVVVKFQIVIWQGWHQTRQLVKQFH